MATYQVSFFKNLLNFDGHPFRCLQDCVEVRDVESPAQAAVRAARQFELMHRVKAWNRYADAIDIAEVRQPARRVRRMPGRAPTTQP